MTALADVRESFGVITDTTNASLADLTLSEITDALQTVAEFRANNGAEQSRFNFASEVLTVNKANLEAATSRIADVDVAAESTQLARYNILVQSGTAMLSQARYETEEPNFFKAARCVKVALGPR